MRVAIIGCGFVADYYMLTLARHPSLTVVAAMDLNPVHAARFAQHWKLPVFTDTDVLLRNADFKLVLNLTNPHAHYAVSMRFLTAGKHVYSEKPLAMTFAEAQGLVAFAESKGLEISSAPCNHLSEAAQAINHALAQGRIGVPKLVYAEMDDGFLALSPYRNWTSASGAPWPYQDEFAIGCTLEHAAYYITWLTFMFGPVRRVAAFASLQHPGKPLADATEAEAPDFSVACLEFHSGIVARLTCSILAPRDHSLRIIGDAGVLYADDCWFYRTPVHIRRYLRIRNRFMLSPLRRRLPLARTGPKAARTGAGAVDFARGPAAMAEALRDRRRSHLPADFALHFTEIMLAIHAADSAGGSVTMQSSFAPLTPVAAPIM